MALARTTLASACGINDTSIVVASATSMAPGRIVQVDNEFMQVIQTYVSGTTVGVTRGQGTATQAHVSGAGVVHGLASDFSASPAGTTNAMPIPAQRATRAVSITATGTLTLPLAGEELVVQLNGTSVIALTVPVPTQDLCNAPTKLWIASNGAAAHTVTFTGGLSGAGSSYDVITVNATAPVALGPFLAVNGLWQAMVAVPMAGTVTNVTATVA